MKILYGTLAVALSLLIIVSVVVVFMPEAKIRQEQPYFQSTSVAHGQKYAVQQKVVGDYFDYAAHEQRLAEKQKETRENQRYAILTSLWKKESDFFAAEQARIEEFCMENGFFYCQDITYACDKEDTCWKVVITCDDVDFEPSRLRYFDYDKRKDCRQWDAKIIHRSKFEYEELDRQDFSDAGVQLGRRIRESVLNQNGFNSTDH